MRDFKVCFFLVGGCSLRVFDEFVERNNVFVGGSLLDISKVFVSSRSELIFVNVTLCMITMPPFLSAGGDHDVWVRLDNACIYLLGKISNTYLIFPNPR